MTELKIFKVRKIYGIFQKKNSDSSAEIHSDHQIMATSKCYLHDLEI